MAPMDALESPCVCGASRHTEVAQCRTWVPGGVFVSTLPYMGSQFALTWHTTCLVHDGACMCGGGYHALLPSSLAPHPGRPVSSVPVHWLWAIEASADAPDGMLLARMRSTIGATPHDGAELLPHHARIGGAVVYALSRSPDDEHGGALPWDTASVRANGRITLSNATQRLDAVAHWHDRHVRAVVAALSDPSA